jgi:hypothetical protein
MSHLHAPQPIQHQLRFMFRHTAPLCCFVANATTGDVAEIWSRISARRAEAPVGVAVSVAPPQMARLRLAEQD